MSTEQQQMGDAWSRPSAARVGDAVPIRRVIGASTEPGRMGHLARQVAGIVGWVSAAVVLFGGGFLLWHLLFGDSVGGDVWLGQPISAAEGSATDDGVPGGFPYSPATTDTSTVSSIDMVVTVPASGSSVPGGDADDTGSTLPGAASAAGTDDRSTRDDDDEGAGGGGQPEDDAGDDDGSDDGATSGTTSTVVTTSTTQPRVSTTTATTTATTRPPTSTSTTSTTTPRNSSTSSTSSTSTTIDDDTGDDNGGGGGNSGSGGGGNGGPGGG